MKLTQEIKDEANVIESASKINVSEKYGPLVAKLVNAHFKYNGWYSFVWGHTNQKILILP